MGSQGNKVGHILWPHQRREVFYPRELGPGCIELNLFNTEKALHCPKTLAGFLESQKPLRIWVWTPMRSGIPAEQSVGSPPRDRPSFPSPTGPPLLLSLLFVFPPFIQTLAEHVCMTRCCPEPPGGPGSYSRAMISGLQKQP